MCGKENLEGKGEEEYYGLDPIRVSLSPECDRNTIYSFIFKAGSHDLLDSGS